MAFKFQLFTQTLRHLKKSVTQDRSFQPLRVKKSNFVCHLDITVGYLQNKFEHLAMLLIGTTTERCDLNPSLYTYCHILLTLNNLIITTFSCTEAMAEYENLIPLPVAGRIQMLQAK